MNNNILLLIAVVTILLAPIIIDSMEGIPMFFDIKTQTYKEVITPYHTFQQQSQQEDLK